MKVAVISRVRYDLVFDDGTVRKAVPVQELIKSGREQSVLRLRASEALQLRASDELKRSSSSSTSSSGSGSSGGRHSGDGHRPLTKSATTIQESRSNNMSL
jgi:hypothetical protein